MAKPDAFQLSNLVPDIGSMIPVLKSFQLPGILVIIAAATQFIQTKMMLPVSNKGAGTETKKLISKKTEVKNFGFLLINLQGAFVASYKVLQIKLEWLYQLLYWQHQYTEQYPSI